MKSTYTWKVLQPKKPTNVRESAAAAAARRNIPSPSHEIIDLGLKQQAVAIDLLRSACSKGKRVAIQSDMDVDGITSGLICAESLRAAGANICHLGNSVRSEGYGLTAVAVERINETKPDLVVVTDIGSSTPDLFDSLSCPAICIDHHRCDLTANFVLLNPHNATEDSSAKTLCSAGLSYELMKLVTDKCSTEQHVLAALGTLADMSELTGYNHAMVRSGLKLLSATARPGLAWMLNQIHVYGRALTGEEVSWKIVPTINAAGRIGEPSTARDAMSLRDEASVTNAARKCFDLNAERKYMTDSAYSYALEVASGQSDCKFILLASSTFHRGIVGLIAGKLVRALNKPVGVGAIERDQCTFSFRSVPGVDLIDLIKQVPELKGAGGHGQAGGGRCSAAAVGAVRDRLGELLVGVELPQPELEIEWPMPANEVGMADVAAIDTQLLPYGQGNRRPVFISRQCELVGRKAMSKGNRFTFKPRIGKEGEFTALSFDMVDIRKGDVVDVAYSAEISRWRGDPELTYMIKDCRDSDGK